MVRLTKPRLLCVGTHHKTGTIWMRRVFHAIAKELNIPTMQCNRLAAMERIPKSGRVLIFNWASGFPKPLLDMDSMRVLHIIRDPRDVLISGMKYHQIAPVQGEKFLHDPQEKLNGKTYQQHIRSLPNDIEKLRFEMKNKHRKTLNEMLAWDYGRPGVTDLRYEDLIEDESCGLFEGVLRDFGFDDNDVKTGVQIFWDNSLFGGLKDKNQREGRAAKHVSSGAAAQWKTKLPHVIARNYLRRFGDDLITLGYEQDKKWVQNQHVTAA